jgi:adenosylmethionine-8-amino-7-oxononanoate aminotransferase
MQAHFVELGVWIRPFGRLVYVMPPFVTASADVAVLTEAVFSAIGSIPDDD